MKKFILTFMAAVILLVVLEEAVNGNKRKFCSNLARRHQMLAERSTDPTTSRHHSSVAARFGRYSRMLILPHYLDM